MKRGLLVLLVAASAAIGWWVGRGAPSEPGAADAPPAARTVAPAAPSPPAGPPRWIGLGGGATPETSQVSLEQDLLLALDVLGPGSILFAGGPGTHAVQVLDREQRGDPLLRRLAELFAPRVGRDAHYRASRLPIAGPATAGALLDSLERAARVADAAPLLLYVAGHGDQGQTAGDNRVLLWADTHVTPVALATALDRGAQRPVVAVVTTCFSGGFAEVAFIGGDPSRGTPPVVRCGLFASTWDREAAGCDPNPERRAQQGYGLYFLNALRGRDAEGRPLPASVLDLDGDGRISLLEAHTRARIASPSADVPSTTSERWLRHVGPAGGPQLRVSLPEETAVVAALEAASRGSLAAIRARIAALEGQLTAADREQEGLYRVAAAELLSRWPVLDDPWHPDFATTLEASRAAIDARLRTSTAYAAYASSAARVAALDAELYAARRAAAPLERLQRARTTVELAERLHARGGPDWDEYQRLLACERWAPGPPAP